MPQGIGADLIATLDGFRREDVDAFALRSQQRAARHAQAAVLRRLVVPVEGRDRPAHPRPRRVHQPRTTLEGLAQLKPAFDQLGAMGFDAVALARYPQVERIHHVHTAGNSSGIVDGAAAVLIGSEAKGRTHGLKPRGRIVAAALSGADPTIMLTGPMPAARKALAKAGLTIDDIDLFEVNEAFAAVPMRFMNEMGVPHEKVNVNGGAIATGPPAGRHRRDDSGHAARRAGAPQLQATAWSRCASAAAWASRRSSRGSELEAPIRYELDADGIATLTFDEPGAPVNTMSDALAGRPDRSRLRSVVKRQGAHQGRDPRLGQDDLLRRRATSKAC